MPLSTIMNRITIRILAIITCMDIAGRMIRMIVMVIMVMVLLMMMVEIVI